MKIPVLSSLSLRQRLFGMVALLAVALLVVGGAYQLSDARRSAEKELAGSADSTMQALEPLFERIFVFYSLDASIDLAHVLPDLLTVNSLELSQPDGHSVFQWVRPGHKPMARAGAFEEQSAFRDDGYIIQRPIPLGGGREGWVSLELSTDRYRAQVSNAMVTYVALALGLLVLFSVVTVWLDRSVASPISRTTEFVENFFSDGRDLRRRLELKRTPRDVQRLQRGINKMLGEMESHDQRLRDSIMQAQLSEKENMDRSRFIATMSHELRTPLNSVIGFAELLDMEQLAPEQRQYLQSIKGAGEHLLSLINDTLDLSKLESGKLEFERKPYRMGKLVVRVTQMFEESSREKSVPIFTALPQGTPDLMVGDQGRVQQILINLIGNAVKFTHHGSITVSVFVSGDERGHRLTVAVKDTGVGIPLHRQAAIFERFQQADSRTTRDFGGTGLGLAIVRELVELMGGEVHLESEPGVGSTFAFSLPMPTAEERAEFERQDAMQAPARLQAESAPAPFQPASDRKLRVLLADDVVANQVVGRRLLESIGCEVVVASNGKLAVEAFGQVPFDIVFLDFHMPEMDGIEATRRIRGMRGGGAIPIWALTADATPEAREQCDAAGMTGVIIKPFQLADLRAALADVGGAADRRALA